MSRSNPQIQSQNPCSKWFEVNSGEGFVFHYDKDAKQKVKAAEPFSFILLDELAVIKGWHEKSQSGITSNEIRDTRQEVFVVKAFKGGELASGHYANIKDRVAAAGGSYNANLYIAFKGEGSKLEIGSLMLRGAALSSWFEFRKEARKQTVEVDGKKVQALYAKAIYIKEWKTDKKGKVTFVYPVFALKDIKPETNAAAIALDKQLQEYLSEYLKRNKAEAAAHPQPSPEGVQEDPPYEVQEEPEPEPEPKPEPEPSELVDDTDVPF